MALFNMLMDAFGAPETGNAITQGMQAIAAPNSIMGQQREKAILEQKQNLFAQIMNSPDLTQQQKLEALSQASPEFAQKRMELMLQPPKPLNAPNVQFNPATGEVMISQYDPNTGQLTMNGAPQGYGQQQGMQGGGIQQPMPQGQPSMPPQVAGMSPRAQGKYQEDVAAGMAKQSGEDAKKGKQADSLLSMIGQAREILPLATGGGAEAYGAAAKGFFGKSDTKTQADSKLGTISGWMVSNVPRMEGPQSNFDVENYKTMAARVGNNEIPIPDRMAALGELEKLQQKYSHLNGGQNMRQAMPQGGIKFLGFE